MFETIEPKPNRPVRRILALHFPFWAIDCLKRAEPALGAEGRPLALYEKDGNALRLVAVDIEALRRRLRVGMALADAQTLCPDALFRAIDPAAVLGRFAALADWHAYVSPIVAIHAVRAPYGDLAIDISGAEHLLGGPEALLAAVTGRVAAMGIAVQGAVAPSLGAAWALARYAPGRVIEERIGEALAPLPVMALRLDATLAGELARMGLRTIGQLYRRNRRALAARFGGEVLLRLDQALGDVAERITPRQPPPLLSAEQRFAEPLSTFGPMLEVVSALAVRLCGQLEAEGAGAQEFRLTLFRVDHCVMELAVRGAGATRDPAHVARLFANRIETLRSDFDAGFGIEMMRLGGFLISPLASRQVSALAGTGERTGLDALYDRLMSRLGPDAVSVAQVQNGFVPERAVRLQSVAAQGAAPALPTAVLGPRPLKLLPVPEPLEVFAEAPDGPPGTMVWRRLSYSFVRTAGPERISLAWWQGEGEALTRDYYSVEDAAGRRFWLFRQGFYGAEAPPRWFLHGVF